MKGLGAIAIVLAVAVLQQLCPIASSAAVVDRVVAYVDEEAVTLRELEAEYARSQAEALGQSRGEVLDALVNRLLLLREAKRMRLSAESDEGLIEEYLDLKLGAFVVVDDEEVARYYNESRQMFAGRGFNEVRGEIEQSLIEAERRRRLGALMKELKGKAYIRTLLEEAP
jgi:hypothetical protein